MLCNAAYAGYVSGRRDTTKAIKGLHEPIVDEALFDRVQQMRRQRARNLKPGRPSQRYLLRGLARCRRCHARCRAPPAAASRQPATTAQPAAPTAPATSRSPRRADRGPARAVHHRVRADPRDPRGILRRLANAAAPETSETAQRRAALEERLTRMRDLYELGDLAAPRVHRPPRRDPRRARRARTPAAPRPRPRPAGARRLHRLLGARDRPRRQAPVPQPHLRAASGSTHNRVVAVQPRPPFLPFFKERRLRAAEYAGVKDGNDGTRTRDLRRDRPAL